MTRTRTRLLSPSTRPAVAPVREMRLHPGMPAAVRRALGERRVEVLAVRGGLITEVFVRNHPA